jgi:amidohydrolase
MAMLLSSARVLYELRDSFGGDIYFLFQPGEELAPGGASLIMKEGILQKINPDAIIAQHVLPELESGKTGFRAGKYMASSDEIYIDILGKGGHAALPGSSSDQVLIASSLICKLKSEISKLKGDIPLVLGIGKIIADGATNVIPEKVHIEGTLRTFDEALRKQSHKLIEKICREAEEENVKVGLEIRKGYPVLINNDRLVEEGIKISDKVNGDGKTGILDMRMSSEDFAFYSQQFPVLFYRLGTLDPGDKIRNLHTPFFDIHEPAMETGVRTMVSIAMELLGTRL